MRRIAIAAAKGGTGKTTTAVHVAHALALQGQRVLLVDCDPRRHAALHFGVRESLGLAAWLAGRSTQTLEVRRGLRLLDSGGTALTDYATASSGDASERLAERLDGLVDVDFVLLDSPPDSGPLQQLALRAAREILVPVGSDFLGLAGAESLRAAVGAFGPRAWEERFVGILPTFYEPGTPSSTQFEALLAGRFPQQAVDVRIRNCDALRLAASLRGSVYDADPLSRGAHDYAELAELLSPCVV